MEIGSIERRVLVLAPTRRDADFCQRILSESGMTGFQCGDIAQLCDELSAGAGTVLLTDEGLRPQGIDLLRSKLEKQPHWSDLPLIILMRDGADTGPLLLERLGNVTLLDRPLRIATLVSATQAALRARIRQYQIRDQLLEAQRTAEILKQADRSKDEFLAMLAHELRNPLAPIRNALYILTQEDVEPEAVDRMHRLMDRQVGHLVRLVDDLLDVSRILRGKVDLQIERLDLATVIARAVETVQPLIDEQRHELSVSMVPTQIEVDGDLVRLAQVFANLLNNAAKYTDKRGRISVSAERTMDEVVVRVRDNGIGIAPEMVPRVFELFTQAERSLDRAQGGLGLGLTLVRSLVEMHRGRVLVSSEGLGRGSEFVVRLPVATSTGPRRSPDRAQLALESVPPRRILVVDDNVDAAVSLSELLEIFGHRVEVAHHGQSALDRADAFAPEVVLLDIGLPGLNGYEVARRLRSNGSCSSLLVAVTGYGQEDDRRKSEEAGFDFHLTKPITIDDLIRVLTPK